MALAKQIADFYDRANADLLSITRWRKPQDVHNELGLRRIARPTLQLNHQSDCLAAEISPDPVWPKRNKLHQSEDNFGASVMISRILVMSHRLQEIVTATQ
jgi:hypothetical protein